MHILIVANKPYINDKLCMNNSQKCINTLLLWLEVYIHVNINKQKQLKLISACLATVEGEPPTARTAFHRYNNDNIPALLG